MQIEVHFMLQVENDNQSSACLTKLVEVPFIALGVNLHLQDLRLTEKTAEGNCYRKVEDIHVYDSSVFPSVYISEIFKIPRWSHVAEIKGNAKKAEKKMQDFLDMLVSKGWKICTKRK